MNANYVLILTKENNEITFYIIDIYWKEKETQGRVFSFLF